METSSQTHNVIVDHSVSGGQDVLEPAVLALVDDLHRRFDARRRNLLAQRADRQAQYDAGRLPGFLRETRHFRNAIWEVDPVPACLRDQRCRIAVAPVSEAIAEAEQGPARVVVADIGRAARHRLDAVIDGHRVLKAHAERTDGVVPMFVQLRPLSEDQVQLRAGGAPVSASLFDIAVHWFHCGRALAERFGGLQYCVVGITHHLEVRLWQEVISYLHAFSGLEASVARISVVIDTLPAAFQMDEILFELRRSCAGLVYDRAGLIASYIGCCGRRSSRVCAPWTRSGMDEGFLDTIRLRLVETCHRRRAHAIIGHFTDGSDVAGQRESGWVFLRALVARDIGCGYDGVVLCSPDAVDVVTGVFDAAMPGPHQMLAQRHYPRIQAEAMLRPAPGPVSRGDIDQIIRIGIGQIANWLDGRSVDISVLEVSRAQVWQWLDMVRLVDGSAFDHRMLDQSCSSAGLAIGERGEDAARIFVEAVTHVVNRPLRPGVHGPV